MPERTRSPITRDILDADRVEIRGGSPPVNMHVEQIQHSHSLKPHTVFTISSYVGHTSSEFVSDGYIHVAFDPKGEILYVATTLGSMFRRDELAVLTVRDTPNSAATLSERLDRTDHRSAIKKEDDLPPEAPDYERQMHARSVLKVPSIIFLNTNRQPAVYQILVGHIRNTVHTYTCVEVLDPRNFEYHGLRRGIGVSDSILGTKRMPIQAIQFGVFSIDEPRRVHSITTPVQVDPRKIDELFDSEKQSFRQIRAWMPIRVETSFDA